MGTYQCQNAGCPNGMGSFFELSEEEEQFYADHGLSAPKNCKDCRRWKKEQKEKYTITCEACGNTRIITPQRRINYHKLEGEWVDPTLCKMCEADPKREMMERERANADMQWLKLRSEGRKTYVSRVKRTAERLGTRRTSRYLDDITGAIVSNPQSFDVLEDAEVYEGLRDHKNVNALRHITKPGHDSLNKLGTNDGQKLILMGSEIAHDRNSKNVTQFQDIESGYVIKRDNSTGQVIVIRQYEGPPPPYRLVTTYQQSDKGMVNKLESGAWVPSK